MTRFEDHELWHPDCNTNNIYITSAQDLIISYCRSPSRRPRGLSPHRLSRNGAFVGTVGLLGGGGMGGMEREETKKRGKKRTRRTQRSNTHPPARQQLNVSNILSGRNLAKVSRERPGAGSSSSSPPAAAAAAAVPEGKAYALDDVTALFYSEARNEIYTGRSDGRLHVWGN